MDFRPMAEAERRSLLTALRRNVDSGTTIRFGRDTSFVGIGTDIAEASDADHQPVIDAVKSVPCHY